jgi:hypothetical protein
MVEKDMTGIMKIGTMIAATGLITTLILPDRKTVQLVNALRKFAVGTQRASMGFKS